MLNCFPFNGYCFFYVLFLCLLFYFFFFFSSRRRHTRYIGDWSSDVCSSDLEEPQKGTVVRPKKLGVLSQDQFAFDRYRVIDTVIMGNRRLWAAFEERDRLRSEERRVGKECRSRGGGGH